MPTYADSSIYNLIRPQQPLPDPMQDYAGMVQLKNLIRADKDTEAANAAWQQSGGDMTKFSQLLAAGGGGYKTALEAQKVGLETKRLTTGIRKDEQEILSKALSLNRDALVGVEDPTKAANWIISSFKDPVVGPKLLERMTPEQALDNLQKQSATPGGFNKWKMSNLSGVDQFLKNIEAQKGRDVTIRGQNQPVWDSERGVFVPKPGTSGTGGGPGPRPEKPVWDAERGAFVTPPLRTTDRTVTPTGGVPGAIAVPGLPKTPKEIKADEAKAKAALIEKTRADIVISKVDEALGQTGFFTTGLTGATLGLVPGTSAYDLDATIDTIKANVGFKELQDMRAASPTGGALGQIAVRELEFLQAAVASLHKGQSQDQIEKNLRSVKTHFENWKKTVEGTKVDTKPIVPNPTVAPVTGGQPKAFDSMPDPAQLNGKQITDTQTGIKYRSDGTKWLRQQ